MTEPVQNCSAGSASELLDLLPRRLDWLFARGRTRPDEPLYGCQIKDGDEIVSQTEHDDPQQCATLAIEGLRVHPCEYCHKKFTGLPSNACENCMNSGLRYPEIERMGSATVEADDIKRFFDGMAAANRRSTHMSDVAQAVGEPVAFVPIHPRQGPLWSDTIPAGSEIQRSNNYPRMALYASQPSPAATVETDAKKRQELAQRLVYVANSMSETMSQGFDSKLFVDPEMRDDLIAAAGLVAAYKRGDAAHSHSSAATEDEPRWYAVDERGNDNFATSIYEAGDKGLLVARCNQNGQYPWQGPAIIRGLAANKQIVPIEPQAFPKWRHLKRGSIVSEVARGFAQVAHHPIEEMTAVVIYKHDADGVYWVRNAVEFDDGRFEPLPSSQLTRPAQQRASNK